MSFRVSRCTLLQRHGSQGRSCVGHCRSARMSGRGRQRSSGKQGLAVQPWTLATASLKPPPRSNGSRGGSSAGQGAGGAPSVRPPICSAQRQPLVRLRDGACQGRPHCMLHRCGGGAAGVAAATGQR